MDEVSRQQVGARQADATDAQAVDWFARHEIKLEPGERFIRVWRDSVLVLFLQLLLPVLPAVALVVGFAFAFRRSTPLEKVLFAVLLPASFAVLVWISVILLRWYFRIYVLTNRRLIRREGIIWRARNEVQLPKVQNASYRSALLQKWVGLGTVKVETASVGQPFAMDNVRDAPGISQRILRAADEFKRERALMDEEQVRRMLAQRLVEPGAGRTP